MEARPLYAGLVNGHSDQIWSKSVERFRSLSVLKKTLKEKEKEEKEEKEKEKESLTQQPQDYAPEGGHSN